MVAMAVGARCRTEKSMTPSGRDGMVGCVAVEIL